MLNFLDTDLGPESGGARLLPALADARRELCKNWRRRTPLASLLNLLWRGDVVGQRDERSGDRRHLFEVKEQEIEDEGV